MKLWKVIPSEMKRIFHVRPGITSLASLHLKDEDKLLSQVSNPDQFHEDVVAPLHVGLPMEHVNRNSFSFDLRILCQTLWAVTVGRWRPIDEHPAVSDLRRKLSSLPGSKVAQPRPT